MDIYKRTRGDVEIIDLDAELRAGDLVWLETPVNPTGESKLASPLWSLGLY